MAALQAVSPMQRVFSGANTVPTPRAARITPRASAAAGPSSIDRRLAMGLLGVVPLVLSAPAASARDVREALRAKEARMRALKEASDKTRKTGQSEQAFSDSEYAVSEDKSPNIHTRQEEGVRTSKS